MRDGLLGWGSYLEGLGCLGTTLLVEQGGLRDLSMADGLVILVNDVNLNHVSPLVRDILGLEAGAQTASNRLIPVILTPK